MDIEQQVGYLVARIEDQGKDIKGLVERVSTMEKTLAEKLITIETVFKVFKYFLIVVVAVATWKFGDITKYWTILFK